MIQRGYRYTQSGKRGASVINGRCLRLDNVEFNTNGDIEVFMYGKWTVLI